MSSPAPTPASASGLPCRPWVASAVVGVAVCLGIIAWIALIARTGRPLPDKQQETPAPVLSNGAEVTKTANRVLPFKASYPLNACPSVEQFFLLLNNMEDISSAVSVMFMQDFFRTSYKKINIVGEENRDGPIQRRTEREDIKPLRQQRTAPISKTASMVCYILITLLVISTVMAIGEVVRDKIRSHDPLLDGSQGTGHAGLPPSGGNSKRPQLSRRCSLVDLTMIRHERRESAAMGHQSNASPILGKKQAKPGPVRPSLLDKDNV